jgi:hypothetical protein
MQAGGAGEAGAADFAGFDDLSQLINECRAHDSAIYHIAM